MVHDVPDKALTSSAVLTEESLHVCRRFVEARREGRPVEWNTVKQEVAAAEQRELLRGLLLIDVHYRRQQGEEPSPQEYLAQLPQHADTIQRTFNQLAKEPEAGLRFLATLSADERSESVLQQDSLDTEVYRPSPSTHASEVDTPRDAVTCGDVQSPPGGVEQFGRYRVRQMLGQGAFAAVYLAEDNELQRLVAVKAPHSECFSSEDQVADFLREAQIAAQLKHPGIVSTFDVGRLDNGMPYVVMEYLPGPTLRAWRDAERPRCKRAAELLADLAEAIAFAHRKGVVHRDLKPSNVLLDEEGRPHVADFGLALQESQQRQRAGERAGTPRYMAPEQVRGEAHRLDGRADIWALGVIFYELLTGRLPFGGENSQQVMDEILHRDARPPRQWDDAIPPELDRIFFKCCAKHAAERYPTALDLARDLRAWFLTQSGVAGDPQQGPRTRPAVWLPAVSLAVAGLLVAGLLLGWPSRRSDESTRPSDRDGSVASQNTAATQTVARAAPERPLSGTVDVFVWDPEDPARRSLSLRDPGVLPLRTADQVRIEAQLNRPAYLYIVWIDSQGAALPVYPWEQGDWGRRPDAEILLDRVALPEAVDSAWEMEGAAGMETLLLLARDTPLPGSADLESLLSGFPEQAMQVPAALVEFVNGEVVTETDDQLRGPKLYDHRQLDDPVLQTQHMIQERLREYFPLIRSLSFANGGEGQF